MLEFLTKSNIRKKIILLFLYNQEREFYLSETAEKVGTSPGTAQRELNKLLKNDFLTFRKKGNLNVYSLNKRYSLLNEVRSIVRKTISAEVELKRELAKIKGITYAFIFGSYVKGGFKADSDIDLFVVGDASEDKIFNAVRKAENNIGREINYHLAHEDEFFAKTKKEYFYKDILKDYILLRGNEDEFRKHIKRSLKTRQA